MQRQFQYEGGDRVLSVSEPQIDEDAWSVNVRLEDASGQTVWEHVIYGIDEVQATLLGLHFGKPDCWMTAATVFSAAPI